MVKTVKPVVIVLMGVCGCGKSSVGELLAARLGWEFVEGDGFHSEENVTKMSRGEALTDADRWGWLEKLADEIESRVKGGQGSVVACSALKRKYRDILRGGCGDEVRFVFLDGVRDLIAGRLKERRGHYMPAGLLDSQFADLERPREGEGVLRVGVEGDVVGIVDEIVEGIVFSS